MKCITSNELIIFNRYIENICKGICDKLKKRSIKKYNWLLQSQNNNNDLKINKNWISNLNNMIYQKKSNTPYNLAQNTPFKIKKFQSFLYLQTSKMPYNIKK